MRGATIPKMVIIFALIIALLTGMVIGYAEYTGLDLDIEEVK